MNLLPHKSWHVWSSKNIEKVERDEQLHEQKQKETIEKERLAESELRLAKLRQRAIEKGLVKPDQVFVNTTSSPSTVQSSDLDDDLSSQHRLNLFDGFDDKSLAITEVKRQPVYKPPKSSRFIQKRQQSIYSRSTVQHQPSSKLSSDQSENPVKKRKRTDHSDRKSSKRQKSIEELRAERVAREVKERERAAKLLAKNRQN